MNADFVIWEKTNLSRISTNALRLSPEKFSSEKVRETNRTSKFCTWSVKFSYLVVIDTIRSQLKASERQQITCEYFSWAKLSPAMREIREWKSCFRTTGNDSQKIWTKLVALVLRFRRLRSFDDREINFFTNNQVGGEITSSSKLMLDDEFWTGNICVGRVENTDHQSLGYPLAHFHSWTTRWTTSMGHPMDHLYGLLHAVWDSNEQMQQA